MFSRYSFQISGLCVDLENLCNFQKFIVILRVSFSDFSEVCYNSLNYRKVMTFSMVVFFWGGGAVAFFFCLGMS